MKRFWFLYLCLPIIISACTPTLQEAPTSVVMPSETPTNSPTLPPPTEPPPTATNTPAPTPTITPLPGSEVTPIDSLGKDIPWLPLDEERRPMSIYYGFNMDKPPFNDVLVRKAFAAATNREEIVAFVADYYFREAEPATTITPTSVLGRNLYRDIGIPFDPEQAKAYLAEAGYTDTGSFPIVKLLVYQRGEAAPSSYYRLAEDVIVPMWETNLGVTVEVEVFPERLSQYAAEIDTTQPDLYILGWGGDQVDPDNFLRELFFSESDFNFGGFSNPTFDNLVVAAANSNDPAERQLMYMDAERILTEEEVGVIPLFHSLYYVGK